MMKIIRETKIVKEGRAEQTTSPSEYTAFQNFLLELLISSDGVDDAHTFEEEGLTTRNKGITVVFNGKKYQLEILGSF